MFKEYFWNIFITMQRIVSFLPSATELIYELGLEKMLFGVTHECEFPEDAKSKPRVIDSVIDSQNLTSGEINQTTCKLLSEGKEIPFKRKFTRTNKFIIYCKQKFGMYVICFWAPFFLSVPLGSIIVAKFYGKLRYTFLYIFIGMTINTSITTFLAYVIFR